MANECGWLNTWIWPLARFGDCVRHTDSDVRGLIPRPNDGVINNKSSELTFTLRVHCVHDSVRSSYSWWYRTAKAFLQELSQSRSSANDKRKHYKFGSTVLTTKVSSCPSARCQCFLFSPVHRNTANMDTQQWRRRMGRPRQTRW